MASERNPRPELSPQAARIHAALPQTQCTRCGYPDCAGYAQALAAGAAQINQCPPGGAEGVQRLAALIGREPLPLNPSNGAEGPRAVAVIDEAWCIGCTLCIDACPTDAILGSHKLMHTIVERYCTGCELCLRACPVDCISLENVSENRTGWQAWSAAEAAQALERYQARARRKAGASTAPSPAWEETEDARLAPVVSAPSPDLQATPADRKRKVIEAALLRARAKRQG